MAALIIGKEKSKQRLLEKTTPKALRSYAAFALVSGTAVIFIGFDYLLKALWLLGNP